MTAFKVGDLVRVKAIRWEWRGFENELGRILDGKGLQHNIYRVEFPSGIELFAENEIEKVE